jgi:(heptosyl)LPS beta-1,4-glucosyltransferase
MSSITTLSAVLIVKNEASMLRDCLESIKWVDNIIILDSGSQDETLNIAREYTNNIFTNDDWQGFGVQRQRAQEFVNTDWIIMIDADERMTVELRQSIEQVIKANTEQTAYKIPRLSNVFGRFIRHSGWYPDYVIRLYRKRDGIYSDSRVHEKLELKPSVQIEPLKGDLLHYTYRDLEHYLVKSAHYAAEWAMQRHSSGRKTSIFNGIMHGTGCFIKMYIIRAGFLDGKQGFLLAVLSAHSTFVKYADLWIKNNTQ